MVVWPPKDPNEVLDYGFDWVLALAETIVTSTFSVTTGAVTLSTPSFTNAGPTTPLNSDGSLRPTTQTTVWLNGGTVGERAEILNRITTSGGRTYDQSARLRLREK